MVYFFLMSTDQFFPVFTERQRDRETERQKNREQRDTKERQREKKVCVCVRERERETFSLLGFIFLMSTDQFFPVFTERQRDREKECVGVREIERNILLVRVYFSNVHRSVLSCVYIRLNKTHGILYFDTRYTK